MLARLRTDPAETFVKQGVKFFATGSLNFAACKLKVTIPLMTSRPKRNKAHGA